MTDRPLTFAAVGDVHGAMHSMVKLLDAWEIQHRRHIDFLLQVGDFEPHRHDQDLNSASMPRRYRDVGDFPDFNQGRAAFDWPVYFIGGNHEPYGYLEEMPKGGQLVPNCHYLGRVAQIELGGLSIVGLTGIFSPDRFSGRPAAREMSGKTRKLFTYFSEEDVARAKTFGRADVLVLHDWPRGAVEPGQERELGNVRRAARAAELGNEAAREIVDALRPKVILAGHMHWRHRSRIGTSLFAAMAHIDAGSDALGVFEVNRDGQIRELPRLDRSTFNRQGP